MTKRILLIAEYSKGTGIGTYLHLLIKYFSENPLNSIKIFFVDTQKEEAEEFIDQYKNLELLYSIYNYYPTKPLLKKAGKFPFSIILDVLFLLKGYIFYKPDFVIITTSSITRYWGSLLFKPASVYVLHSVPTRLKNYLKINSGKIINRLLIKNKLLLTVSEYTKNQIITLFNISDQRIKVIHNTVIVNSQILKTISKVDKDIQILTIGNIVAYKNFQLWVEVAKRLCINYKHVKFTWIGKCLDKILYEKAILQIPENLKQRINVIPYSVDPAKHLGDCDIYFHPSNKENHSLSILEALNYSKPVVCAETGGNSESITHNVNGFIFKNNDIFEAQKYLELLISEYSIREKFSFHSRNIFMEKFSYPIWKDEMDKTISNLSEWDADIS